MIYTTGTISVNGNTLTGSGTNFTAAGSLIRVGCTVIALSNPVQVFQITSINSATSLAVTPAASPSISGQKYAILLSDSLSVDGMAQDIAEVVKMYQGNMSGFVDVMNGTGDVTVMLDGKSVSVPGQKSLAKKGSNSDITELKGLKTALSVSQGGTGATDAAGIRQNAGLGTASTRDVGTASGNLMQVGAFGWGAAAQSLQNFNDITKAGLYTSLNGNSPGLPLTLTDFSLLHLRATPTASSQIYVRGNSSSPLMFVRVISDANQDGQWFPIYNGANTTKSSDGTLKAASPVIRIASPDTGSRTDIDEDNFEWCGYGVANDEARGVEIVREDTGVYRITGALSLASSGWTLFPPRDPAGSGDLGIAEAEQDGDSIIVRLYKRRMVLNEDGDIDVIKGKPIDVPVNSWIDVRLDMPETATPEPVETA